MSTAVYMPQRRVQDTVFTAADFPRRDLIEGHLQAHGYELDANYEGESLNPFLVEAFKAAIAAGNLDVFDITHVQGDLGRMVVILHRFGVQSNGRLEVLAGSISRVLSLPAGDNLYYYYATLFLAGRAARTNREDRPYVSQVGLLGQVIDACTTHGISPLFSAEKIALLVEFAVKMKSLPRHPITRRRIELPKVTDYTGNIIPDVHVTLAYLAAFTVAEMQTILIEDDPQDYHTVGRTRAAFGRKSLAETRALLARTNGTLLRDILPKA